MTEYETTPDTVTAANAATQLERRMSDLIDLFAIFIEEGKQVDPRAWEHLLIYAPKHPAPEEVAGLLADLDSAFDPMGPRLRPTVAKAKAVLQQMAREIQRRIEEERNDAETIAKHAARIRELIDALKFAHDLAAEELPHAKVGTGAEVALRHIKRKTSEALRAAGIQTEGESEADHD